MIGDNKMTKKEFAEAIALMDKIKVEMNPNLTRQDKELWKTIIDYFKSQV